MKSFNRPISLFVPTLRGGGAERVMIMLANGLAKENLETHLVTGTSEGTYKSLIKDGVELIDFKKPRLLSALPSLACYLFKTKPHTLLSAIDHANTAAVVIGKVLSPRTRYIISIHNSLSAAPARSMTAKMTQFLTGLTLRNADKIVTVSEAIRDQICTKYEVPAEKVTAIYNPLDVDFISEQADMPLNHPWFSDNIPVVIGIGRLTRQKNFANLIRAISIVNSERPCRLIILGEGELKNELQELILDLHLTDQVQLVGFVDNPYAWLRNSEVFALSSDWEGLPGVLLEALATGTSIVSTNCETGPSEILQNGKWGVLVPPQDSFALASGILHALERKKFPELKDRANDFRTEKAIAKYLDLLNGV